MTELRELGAMVKLITSDEVGTIVGRAEYLNSEPSYYVRYKAADGRQTECWWSSSAVSDA